MLRCAYETRPLKDALHFSQHMQNEIRHSILLGASARNKVYSTAATKHNVNCFYSQQFKFLHYFFYLYLNFVELSKIIYF